MPPVEEEKVVLDDGAVIYVRPIRPSDRPLFLEGMRHISAETWLYRFLMPRDHLDEAELDYLLSPDGVHHFALGACTRDEHGDEGPVAVARYARMPDTDEVAECAIVVVDAWQGRGVGRDMGERLMAAARARGIRAFHCEILLENERMMTLIRALAPESRSHVVGSHAIFRVPLVPGALDAFAEPELDGALPAVPPPPERKARGREKATGWTGRWKVAMFWRSREADDAKPDEDA